MLIREARNTTLGLRPENFFPPRDKRFFTAPQVLVLFANDPIPNLQKVHVGEQAEQQPIELLNLARVLP